MNNIKLYNLIFPIWILIFFPPVIFITLGGNFIIDSIVLVICYYVFKLNNSGINLKTFYKKSILFVWIYGFLADFIGALLLFTTQGIGFSYELSAAILYDPFSNPFAVMIIVISMMVSGFFVFLFNVKFSFKNQIIDKKLKFKVALTIAIITIPWTFLLPTKWFYY